MSKTARIVLCGASGRMGRRILALAQASSRAQITAEIDRKNSRQIRTALQKADAVIDFSAPRPSIAFATEAARARIPILIGTTGFSPAQIRKLKALSQKTAILLAPNCSPGMTLLFELARSASKALASYDAVISETHHRKKKDAPSGSAKRLADSVIEADPRRRKVPTISLRAGDIIGDHTLTLAGPDERLELTHRAHNRDVFARGALSACLWLLRKRKGLFSMRDTLGTL